MVTLGVLPKWKRKLRTTNWFDAYLCRVARQSSVMPRYTHGDLDKVESDITVR